MKEAYSQTVEVIRGENHVHLISTAYPRDTSSKTETKIFPSFASAKKTLTRERRIYKGFQVGYELLTIGEGLALFYGLTKTIIDLATLVTDKNYTGEIPIREDAIAILLIAMFGIITLLKSDDLHDDVTKTDNKLMAIQNAEERQEDHTITRYKY